MTGRIKNNQGMILMIVIVFIAGLTYTVIEYSRMLLINRKIRDYYTHGLKARLNAESGLNLARVLIETGKPLKTKDNMFIFTDEVVSGGIYIRIVKDADKKDINASDRNILIQEIRKLDDEKCEQLSSFIQDYLTRSGNLGHINELIYTPGLDYNTIYGNIHRPGLIDLFTARGRNAGSAELTRFSIKSIGTSGKVNYSIHAQVSLRNGRTEPDFLISN